MKILKPVAVAWAVTSLVACGAGQTEPASPDDTVESPGITEDPGGTEAPDTSVSSDTPVGEAPAGPPCEQEIALECAEGMTDGCLLTTGEGASLTTIHICVPSSETASQPCEQEIARECGDGLTDACMLTPAPATTHICVAAP